jgi:hypothetical protein
MSEKATIYYHDIGDYLSHRIAATHTARQET